MEKMLVLGRDDLLTWLRNPALRSEFPEFAAICDLGDRCWKQYAPTFTARCCGGETSLMFPALDAFLAALQEATPEMQERLRAFLAERRGFVPKPVRIIYRKTSRPGDVATLTF